MWRWAWSSRPIKNRCRGQLKVSLNETTSLEIPSSSEARSTNADQAGCALSNRRRHSEIAPRHLVRPRTNWLKGDPPSDPYERGTPKVRPRATSPRSGSSEQHSPERWKLVSAPRATCSTKGPRHLREYSARPGVNLHRRRGSPSTSRGSRWHQGRSGGAAPRRGRP